MGASTKADHFPPELGQLTATTITVLDKHLNLDGHCAACTQPWPCQPAQLAGHNLAGL